MAANHLTGPVTYLAEWSPQEAIANGRELASILGEEDTHPALKALFDGCELRIKQIQVGLMNGSGKQEGAYYAKFLGEMQGLREIQKIAEQIVKNGEANERLTRQAEEAEVGSE